jgi:hypothetical protein
MFRNESTAISFSTFFIRNVEERMTPRAKATCGEKDDPQSTTGNEKDDSQSKGDR